MGIVLECRSTHMNMDLTNVEWASDCCWTPNEQFFSYIVVRTTYISTLPLRSLEELLENHISVPASVCNQFLKCLDVFY